MEWNEVKHISNIPGKILSFIGVTRGVVAFRYNDSDQKALFHHSKLFLNGKPCSQGELSSLLKEGDKVFLDAKLLLKKADDYSWIAILVWTGKKPENGGIKTEMELPTLNLSALKSEVQQRSTEAPPPHLSSVENTQNRSPPTPMNVDRASRYDVLSLTSSASSSDSPTQLELRGVTGKVVKLLPPYSAVAEVVHGYEPHLVLLTIQTFFVNGKILKYGTKIDSHLDIGDTLRISAVSTSAHKRNLWRHLAIKNQCTYVAHKSSKWNESGNSTPSDASMTGSVSNLLVATHLNMAVSNPNCLLSLLRDLKSDWISVNKKILHGYVGKIKELHENGCDGFLTFIHHNKEQQAVFCKDDIYLHGVPFNDDTDHKIILDDMLYFDGVPLPEPFLNCTYRAVMLWKGKKMRNVQHLEQMSSSGILKTNTEYAARVIELCPPSGAIAEIFVNSQLVCVFIHKDNLRSSAKDSYVSSSESIDTYLKTGTTVGLKVKLQVDGRNKTSWVATDAWIIRGAPITSQSTKVYTGKVCGFFPPHAAQVEIDVASGKKEDVFVYIGHLSQTRYGDRFSTKEHISNVLKLHQVVHLRIVPHPMQKSSDLPWTASEAWLQQETSQSKLQANSCISEVTKSGSSKPDRKPPVENAVLEPGTFEEILSSCTPIAKDRNKPCHGIIMPTEQGIILVEQYGEVKSVTPSGGLIHFNLNCKTEMAVFHCDQLFINGQKCASNFDHSVIYNEIVAFDAKKLWEKDESGAWYRALIVWQGKKPADVQFENELTGDSEHIANKKIQEFGYVVSLSKQSAVLRDMKGRLVAFKSESAMLYGVSMAEMDLSLFFKKGDEIFFKRASDDSVVAWYGWQELDDVSYSTSKIIEFCKNRQISDDILSKLVPSTMLSKNTAQGIGRIIKLCEEWGVLLDTNRSHPLVFRRQYTFLYGLPLHDMNLMQIFREADELHFEYLINNDVEACCAWFGCFEMKSHQDSYNDIMEFCGLHQVHGRVMYKLLSNMLSLVDSDRDTNSVLLPSISQESSSISKSQSESDSDSHKRVSSLPLDSQAPQIKQPEENTQNCSNEKFVFIPSKIFQPDFMCEMLGHIVHTLAKLGFNICADTVKETLSNRLGEAFFLELIRGVLENTLKQNGCNDESVSTELLHQVRNLILYSSRDSSGNSERITEAVREAVHEVFHIGRCGTGKEV